MAERLGARAASGLVLGAAAIAATYWGGWVFVVLAAAVGMLLANEWDRLCGGSGLGPQALIHAAAIAATALCVGAGWVGTAAIVIVVGTVLSAAAAAFAQRGVAWAVGGLLFTCVPVLALVWLRLDDAGGRLAVLWLFAVVWSTDTGAYFVGRAAGGPKLAPTVSPGKTWSGSFGGIAAAALAGLAVALATGAQAPWAWVAVSIVFSIVGQAGDLAKSKVKRHFHVKDSGHLIPGHGGVLDRLDSTLATAPLAAALLVAAVRWGIQWQ